MALISFQHRFIFVKTQKTAGTSVETDLSPRLEPEAIVTPIIPPEPGHVARNYQDDQGNALYFNHMPLTLIRERLGAGQFNSMARICIEREPVSKCISHFHMLRNSPIHDWPDGVTRSWDEYVEEGRFPYDLQRYSEVVDGERQSLVTHVLRYDRLKTDLPALMAVFGIPDFQLKARAKAEYSQNRLITPDQVTPEQRKRIMDAFRPSAELLHLDWDQGA